MSQEHLREINSLLPRPSGVYYLTGLVPLLGRNAALMLSQLLYWHELGHRHDGWFYKTIDEFEKETGLTRSMQDEAIRVLVENDFITVYVMGIPAKRHFRVEYEHLRDSLMKIYKLGSGTVPHQSAEKSQTITESTPENTQDITQESQTSDSKESNGLPAASKKTNDVPINLDDIPF